ncbi:MAG: hypothetical protein M1814_002392 [Vezdaea aestivalis]|nr:MAG: hypothetical protein M1814_002392 [Vezdaea aestivalis]
MVTVQLPQSANTNAMDDFGFSSDQRKGSNDSIDGPSRPGADLNTTKDHVPRPKRIACCLCRKRKLKCDGNRPICGTCSRLGHDCRYEEVRRKSGPKRGYVKALEARLAQVETLLKTQDPSDLDNTAQTIPDREGDTSNGDVAPTQPDFISTHEGVNFAIGQRDESPLRQIDSSDDPEPSLTLDTENLQNMMDFDIGLGSDTMSWEMLSLGLEEPLPAQEIIDELEVVYFQKIHPSAPMIHEGRYRASCNLTANMRPAIHLRYAMWCLAATVSAPHSHLADALYQRSRKYLELAEMNNVGEAMIGIQTCQCWSLVASYEFKLMYFPRAWMSTGRACRMAQMMGLYRLDAGGLDVKQCIPPPRDWIEREERRRTFWMAFCQDRYASVGTGWPMVLDEKDFGTNLPSSEKAYASNTPEDTMSLKDSMTASGIAKLTPFAALILMACLFGRNLIHLHRPDDDKRDDDLNGAFWRRHRHMDGILLNTSLSLPQHLRLPDGINDTNVVFVNMNIHTATICLHQAAIFKSDKHRLPGNISAESKIRCITAAAEIATIMRTISHLDLSTMNPFMAFCLYVSARVFVQYLKSRPQDENARSSLKFLLLAMQKLKSSNPLVESFLVQLDVDLESVGLDGFQSMTSTTRANACVNQRRGQTVAECSPLISIRETQNPPAPDPSMRANGRLSGSIPRDPIQDQVPAHVFSSDSQINLPNRLKANYRAKNDSWQQPAASYFSQSPLESTSLRPQGPRYKSSDPAEFTQDGFSRVPDLHFSPESNGSNSGGINSGGHPTPDTTASNQSSSHHSYTPPSYEPLPTEHHHTGGATAAGGALGMWAASYDMDPPSGPVPEAAKEPETAAFTLSPDWNMQAGIGPTELFQDFNQEMENVMWDGNIAAPPYHNVQQRQAP